MNHSFYRYDFLQLLPAFYRVTEFTGEVYWESYKINETNKPSGSYFEKTRSECADMFSVFLVGKDKTNYLTADFAQMEQADGLAKLLRALPDSLFLPDMPMQLHEVLTHPLPYFQPPSSNWNSLITYPCVTDVFDSDRARFVLPAENTVAEFYSVFFVSMTGELELAAQVKTKKQAEDLSNLITTAIQALILEALNK